MNFSKQHIKVQTTEQKVSSSMILKKLVKFHTV